MDNAGATFKLGPVVAPALPVAMSALPSIANIDWRERTTVLGRDVAAELARLGYVNERGAAFSPSSSVIDEIRHSSTTNVAARAAEIHPHARTTLVHSHRERGAGGTGQIDRSVSIIVFMVIIRHVRRPP
jgi:hypothetical protein